MQQPVKASNLNDEDSAETSLQRSESSPKNSLTMHDFEVEGFSDEF